MQFLKETKQKIFLIVNLCCFGDILLTNTLCQNLKLEYPDCKVIFLVNKPFIEAAKYQKDVDDVICMNKRKEHKGLLGLIKFAANCKYRGKIDAAFVIYGNPRGMIASRLLGAKKIISDPPYFVKFLATDIPSKNTSILKIQDNNAHLFQGYTEKKARILSMRYNVSPKENFITQKIITNFKGKELIGLCCISKSIPKDMPINTAIDIINKLYKKNRIVLLFGNGKKSRDFADKLKRQGCFNFVDLIDITSIYDLANIIAVCKLLISVDTGTMHLGYSVGCRTICIFYQKGTEKNWAPDEKLYNVKVITGHFKVEDIISNIE